MPVNTCRSYLDKVYLLGVDYVPTCLSNRSWMPILKISFVRDTWENESAGLISLE